MAAWTGSALLNGGKLARGERLESGGGRAALELGADGVLRLLHDGNEVWHAFAPGVGESIAEVSVAVAGLVGRSNSGKGITFSAAQGLLSNPHLLLSDDGRLELLDTWPVWNAGPLPSGGPHEIGGLTAPDALPPNDSLKAGDYSANVDGVLRVRGPAGIVWSSPISVAAHSYLAVSEAADVIAFGSPVPRLVSTSGRTLWSAPITPPPDEKWKTRYQLHLYDNGSMVLVGVHTAWQPANVGALPPLELRDLCEAVVGKYRLTDGSAAIEFLGPRNASDGTRLLRRGKAVIILVEGRLFDLDDNGLNSSLETLQTDLRNEGYDARLIVARLYSGPLLEDGSIVLALRDFFKSIRAAAGMAGAILVGRFPQATIVRRWLWATGYPSPVVSTTAPAGQEYVQCWPEPVANWSDIVLADLSGNWSHLYHQRIRIPAFKGIANEGATLVHNTTKTFAPGNYLDRRLSFNDVFYIQEDDFRLTIDDAGAATARINMQRRDPEVFEPFTTQPNPVAQPDIFLSRVDAYGAAFSADATDRDAGGRNWIDSSGHPQEVDPSIASGPLDDLGRLVHDDQLEVDLLSSYLRRNHRHRAQTTTVPDRVASVSSEDFAGQASAHADALGQVLGTATPPIVLDGVGLDRYSSFWASDASLRAIHAHTSSVLSEFPTYIPGSSPRTENPTAAVAPLNAFLPSVYRWHTTGSPTITAYTPGAEGQEHADFWIHRSIWLNRRVSRGGSFVVHYGCDSPNAVDTARPYTDIRYARGQLAACIMFYSDALALYGRTKVYFDTPYEFLRLLNQRHAGAAWAQLYIDAQAKADYFESPVEWVNAKISYSWVLLGDWTLRRRVQLE